MLCDNVYMLSEILHRFLLDHPGLQEGSVAESKADFTQQFEDWLERETEITDLSHKVTLLQLVSGYEELLDMRDVLTMPTGL